MTEEDTPSTTGRGDPPGDKPNAERSPSERETTTVPRGLLVAVSSVLLVVLVAVILSELASIFRPLLIAVFLGYLIVPAHRWLVQRRIPSAVSYLLIVLVVLVVFDSIGTLIFHSFADMGGKIDGYVERVGPLVNDVIADLTEKFPRLEATIREWFSLHELDPKNVDKILGNVVSAVGSTAGTFFGFLTWALVVVVYLVFLLAEVGSFRYRLQDAFGEDRSEEILKTITAINRAVSQYIALKISMSLLVAGLAAAVLAGFGVDFWMLWAVLTFFANFIPYIGSVVASIFPVLLSVVQFAGEPWKPVAIALCLVGIQQVTGNIVEPKLSGRRLGVSPLLILLALAFWGWLWGIVGMVLAVPITVVIKIVLEKFEATRPIAVLVSSR